MSRQNEEPGPSSPGPGVPMAQPDIRDEDHEAVKEVLDSGRLAMGPKGEAFGQAVADRVGTDHGVALSSGTAALHVSLCASGLGDGDVVVPSFTFAATVNAVLFEGARPKFVDIHPETLTVDPEAVKERVDGDTEAIIPVDIFGHPADWDPILDIADDHELTVIDDACEALGAQYKGEPVGSFGDAATFGFYPNKQITTGEGGVLVTDDKALAERGRSLRNQGRDSTGAWLNHRRLGYNYRLDEMSAALGLSQLGRLDDLLAARRRVAANYGKRLENLDGIETIQTAPWAERSWFVYPVLCADHVDRDGLMEELESRGIPTRAYFPPVHREPYLQDRLEVGEIELPVTETISQRVLALPFHPQMEASAVERVVQTVQAATSLVREEAR